jgi:hypothetical protein
VPPIVLVRARKCGISRMNSSECFFLASGYLCTQHTARHSTTRKSEQRARASQQPRLASTREQREREGMDAAQHLGIAGSDDAQSGRHHFELLLPGWTLNHLALHLDAAASRRSAPCVVVREARAVIGVCGVVCARERRAGEEARTIR